MKINGAEEALKILRSLGPNEQKSLIEAMRIKDPLVAAALEAHLVSIEDIKNLTPKMFQAFIQGTDTDTFALALRGCTEDLHEFVKKNLSSRLWADIDDVLSGPPQKSSKVNEAQKKIIDILRVKQEKGLINLNASSDEYV